MGSQSLGPLNPNNLKTLQILYDYTHVQDLTLNQHFFIYNKYFRDKAAYDQEALKWQFRKASTNSMVPSVIHYEVLEHKICKHSLSAVVVTEAFESTLQDFRVIPARDVVKIGIECCKGFARVGKNVSPAYEIREDMIGFNKGRVKVWVNKDLSRNEPDGPVVMGSRQELEERQATSILQIVQSKLAEERDVKALQRLVRSLKRPLKFMSVAEHLLSTMQNFK